MSIILVFMTWDLPSISSGKIEKALLGKEFSTHFKGDNKLLDFACGTGRIAGFCKTFFNDIQGIDVSESMIDIAKAQHPWLRVVKADITTESPFEHNTFDIITAFRFFTNADNRLRRESLLALHKILKPNGHLICNFHLNPCSMSGILLRSLKRPMQRRLVSVKQAKSLLHSCGFSVLRVLGYGLLPHFRERAFLGKLSYPIEIRLLGKAPSTFNQNFIVVAKPSSKLSL